MKKQRVKVSKFFLLVMVALLVSSMTIQVFASSPSVTTCEITNDYVVIDGAKYDVVDNKVEYNGNVYEISNGRLERFDKEGNLIILALPTKDNMITDPQVIEELNKRFNSESALNLGIPTEYKTLPYGDDVPEGQWNTITPIFQIPTYPFYYGINLELSKLPLFSDKRFQIIYSFCDSLGQWYSETENYSFALSNRIRFENNSAIRYGYFSITNLYDNPSPSYRYDIYMSEL